jgi:hypothetical protein
MISPTIRRRSWTPEESIVEIPVRAGVPDLSEVLERAALHLAADVILSFSFGNLTDQSRLGAIPAGFPRFHLFGGRPNASRRQNGSEAADERTFERVI